MSKYYILDGDHRVIEADRMAWCQFFENTEKRTVEKTQVMPDVTVSTVFLGIDHRFGDDGPPLLFETMVFGGLMDQDCQRYSSWNDAVDGHSGMVRKVRQAIEVYK